MSQSSNALVSASVSVSVGASVSQSISGDSSIVIKIFVISYESLNQAQGTRKQSIASNKGIQIIFDFNSSIDGHLKINIRFA